MRPGTVGQYLVMARSGRISAAAPGAGPKTLFTPPRTEMMRTFADLVHQADSMRTERLKRVKGAPATPANVPEGTKAASRTRRTRTPRTSARRAFSLVAPRMRPRAESTIVQSTAAQRTTTPRQRWWNPAGSAAHESTATPTKPSSPPVTSSHWKATAQTSCKRAGVSMAR